MRFTIRDLVWLTALVAVALAVLRPRPSRWEYKSEHRSDVVAEINTEGDKGWELVDVEALPPPNNGAVFHFKRQKSN